MPASPISGPIDGVALDLWYTTWYHRPSERVDYHRAKRRAWIRSLADAGVSTGSAQAALDRLRETLNRIEAGGRACTLADQARWVGRWLGARVDVGRLIERLDRALANARIHPTPGIRPFLEHVRSQGIPVGMVSNICDESPGGIRARMETEGLLEWFDAIILSSEYGRAKPDPVLFRRCFRSLGVAPARMLFVGDMPVDHLGAERSHAQFILYLGVDRESPLAYRRKRLTEPPTTPRAHSWTEVESHCVLAQASR
jgi:HAD superfamily hydrolase (TIGR01509 family)